MDKLLPVVHSSLDFKYKVIGTFLLLIIYSVLIGAFVVSFLIQIGAVTFPSELLLGGFRGASASSYGLGYQTVLAVSTTVAIIGWTSIIIGTRKFTESPWEVPAPIKYVSLTVNIVFAVILSLLTFAGLLIFRRATFFVLEIGFDVLVLLVLVVLMLMLSIRGSYDYLVLFAQLFLILPLVLVILGGFISFLSTPLASGVLGMFLIYYLNTSALWVPIVYMTLTAFFSPSLVSDVKKWATRKIGKGGGYFLGTAVLLYVIYTQLYPGLLVALYVVNSLYGFPALPNGYSGILLQPVLTSFGYSLQYSLFAFPLIIYALLKLLSVMVRGSFNQSQTKARLLISAGFVILISTGVIIWEATLAQMHTSFQAVYWPGNIVMLFFVSGSLIASFACLYGMTRMVRALRAPEQIREQRIDLVGNQAMSMRKGIGLFIGLITATFLVGAALFIFFRL